jgi:hypothetical protein
VEPQSVPRPAAPGGVLARYWHQWTPAWLGRLLTALVLGLLLGVVGLPAVGPPIRLGLLPSGSADGNGLATQASSPTPAPATPAEASGGVVLDTRFAAPMAGWPNDTQSTAWFGAGGYHVFAREPGRFVVIGAPLPAPLGDARVSARFTKLDGPIGGAYGIVVRDQAPPSSRDGRNQAGRFVVLEASDQGDVAVWQRQATTWVDLVPWTHADAVHLAREPNQLTVSAQGSKLRFEVNGSPVVDLTDLSIEVSGGVGLFVAGDLNHVVVDALRIELP